MDREEGRCSVRPVCRISATIRSGSMQQRQALIGQHWACKPDICRLMAGRHLGLRCYPKSKRSLLALSHLVRGHRELCHCRQLP
jgi:hypothetical protein